MKGIDIEKVSPMTFDESAQITFNHTLHIGKENLPQEDPVEEKRENEDKIITKEKVEKIIPIEEQKELQEEVVGGKEDNRSGAKKNEYRVEESKNSIDEKDIEEKPASKESKNNEIRLAFCKATKFAE